MKNKIKISRKVLLELAKDENVKEILKKECPDLFSDELVVGKWYKSSKYGKALLISKAPEMLEMLNRMMLNYDKGTQTFLDCQQLIKQATEL